jgi:hypothetical protein
MSGNKTLVALAAVTALGLLGPSSAVANDRTDNRGERGGSVVRCSLDGVNPAHHPEVFGNAATAASFGFLQARDGSWHVRPDCRR